MLPCALTNTTRAKLVSNVSHNNSKPLRNVLVDGLNALRWLRPLIRSERSSCVWHAGRVLLVPAVSTFGVWARPKNGLSNLYDEGFRPSMVQRERRFLCKWFHLRRASLIIQLRTILQFDGGYYYRFFGAVWDWGSLRGYAFRCTVDRISASHMEGGGGEMWVFAIVHSTRNSQMGAKFR